MKGKFLLLLIAVSLVLILILPHAASETSYVLDSSDPNVSNVCAGLNGIWNSTSHVCRLRIDKVLNAGDSLTVNSGVNFEITLPSLRLETYGASITNLGTIYNSGTIISNGFITNSGNITNGGTIFNEDKMDSTGNIRNAGIIDNAGAINNSGTIDNYLGHIHNARSATFVNKASGNISNRVVASIVNDGNFSNQGYIDNRLGEIKSCDFASVFTNTGTLRGDQVITSCSSTNETTASTGGGGGIPEFPYPLLATVVLTSVVVSSYLLTRRYKTTLRSYGGFS